MTDILNLGNYEFNEYSNKYMLNCLVLEDITGVEEILVEKIKEANQ